MWQGMLDEIRAQAAYQLLTTQVMRQQQTVRRPQLQLARANVAAVGGGDSRPEPVRALTKLGRNDLCWCGSGKKYKYCHYKTDRGGK
jgi:preprotein translocase subunit SecA